MRKARGNGETEMERERERKESKQQRSKEKGVDGSDERVEIERRNSEREER